MTDVEALVSGFGLMCRNCHKPARYQCYTGRAYCSPHCGGCFENERLPHADQLDRLLGVPTEGRTEKEDEPREFPCPHK